MSTHTEEQVAAALPNNIAALQDQVRQLTHERNALAAAIQKAAVAAGICNADAPLTGPHLLMLCADMGLALQAPPGAATDQPVPRPRS